MTIGNKYEDETLVHCILCRRPDNLFLIAHRIEGKLVGYIFCCKGCFDDVKGKELLLQEAKE